MMEPNAAERDAILAFARELREEDLLYLRTDITDPAVVDDWLESVRNGNTVSLLAKVNANVAGYASIHREPAKWTRWVGELPG
jgi:hypothetical protein